jgi:LCP family protein required for cell wall assembly
MATETDPSPARAPDADGRDWRRVVTIVGIVLGALAVVLGAIAIGVYLWADARLDREVIDAIGQRDPDRAAVPDALNFLVVGSDSREGLTDEEAQRLELGDFDDERADTILIVQIHQGREQASVISLPRDTRIVTRDGGMRVNEALELGPSSMVEAVEAIAGTEMDHFVEVSIPGFLIVVEAIGTVEICLEEPLRDEQAGADFEAGCQDMTAEEALAFVRSREGARGDFRRIERQHKFVEAVLDELTAARTLLRPDRLVRIVERASRNITTDEDLGLREMRALADEIRDVVEGDLRTTTVPSFAEEIDGIPYVIPYQPGARALFNALGRGDLPEPRGTAEERADVDVVLWTAGQQEGAVRVQSTLFFSGFGVEMLGGGPLSPGRTTSVHALGEDEEPAQWVAAVLGVRVTPLPADATAPTTGDVLVVAGEDTDFDMDIPAPRLRGTTGTAEDTTETTTEDPGDETGGLG